MGCFCYGEWKITFYLGYCAESVKMHTKFRYGIHTVFNPLKPNDADMCRTAPLTSKRSILYIYSTNICTEYFKHGIYSPCFPLQNAVCSIILTYLVPVLFTFYIQGVLKLKNNSHAKRLNSAISSVQILFTKLFPGYVLSSITEEPLQPKQHP